MTTDEKIVKTKVGLLRLAEQLGNVSQACKTKHLAKEKMLEIFFSSPGSELQQNQTPNDFSV